MVWCDLVLPQTIFCKKKTRKFSNRSCVISLPRAYQLAFLMQIVLTLDLAE